MNWIWERSAFFRKELIKKLSEDSDSDWSSRLGDFNEKTADDSGGV